MFIYSRAQLVLLPEYLKCLSRGRGLPDSDIGEGNLRGLFVEWSTPDMQWVHKDIQEVLAEAWEYDFEQTWQNGSWANLSDTCELTVLNEMDSLASPGWKDLPSAGDKNEALLMLLYAHHEELYQYILSQRPSLYSEVFDRASLQSPQAQGHVQGHEFSQSQGHGTDYGSAGVQEYGSAAAQDYVAAAPAKSHPTLISLFGFSNIVDHNFESIRILRGSFARE
jgi:hypothetical protein